MRAGLSIIIWSTLIFGYWSGTVTCLALNQAKPQSDIRVIDSLPAPDDQEISKIRTPSQWHNPYVIVTADGYALVLHDQPRSSTLLTLDELEQALLKLPRGLWPLGRIVAVQESGLRAADDNPKIAANLKALIRMLKSHKLIVSDYWPSG
jgi:hypothetical protein